MLHCYGAARTIPYKRPSVLPTLPLQMLQLHDAATQGVGRMPERPPPNNRKARRLLLRLTGLHMAPEDSTSATTERAAGRVRTALAAKLKMSGCQEQKVSNTGTVRLAPGLSGSLHVTQNVSC